MLLIYGRFSGDHVWPVLGVHRGFTDLAITAQTQEAYVDRVERLLHQLDRRDAHLRSQSRDPFTRKAFPSFYALEQSVTIEAQLLSFDPGASIAAHDHPDMTGTMACLRGRVSIETYEPLMIDNVR